MVERRKPKEDKAPAYMAQYTSLMTILLAFFICMLTMGQQQAARYKKTGYGYIRDAFAFKGGGLGVLPYWRNLMGRYPTVERTEEDEKKEEERKDLVGYLKGMFEADQLDDESILKTDLQSWGYILRIPTPISFVRKGTVLDSGARSVLDRIGNVFYNMPEFEVTICSYESKPDFREGIFLASRRASVMALYLRRVCRLPEDRVRAVGYAHAGYLGYKEDEIPSQATVLLVRKRNLDS